MKTFYLLVLGLLAIGSAVSALSLQYQRLQFPLLLTQGSVQDCGSPDDIFHLESITVTPDPPKRGENLTVDVKGYLDEDVDAGAYADVRVKLGLIKLLDTRINLCDEITRIDRECPIEKGPVHINHTVELPRELPPGKYQVFIDVTNYDEKHAACLKAEFRL
ncbi:sterol transporter [Spizellomyces punctatus DAOM BR117]|uniref:Phosphatidylglycerol/phosphatidylinositol transfer protein n=1 Tax=Spizellomyces punctatus (strain DAOM BR117) TaxID=645134 RepID=A0A0L0HI29_SPIPD|nr:sterol transporter [Spizellomyces punctatus DAOM BR117]KND00757.1 hypothetical protein SPPG_03870 [Spizellomyces punctatus DAOM BR117]|eukprot:XP_016608796.1 hypothetical protein SPPG_03870 [Spizellomyces punctatus DAOM BR117]